MEKLILARHGHYTSDGDRRTLSNWGKREIESLISELKRIVDGESVLVLSSPASWVTPCSAMIAKALECGMENSETLHLPDNEPEYTKLVDFLKPFTKKETPKILILVTHKECVEEFPCFYGRSMWGGLKIYIPKFSIDFGQAVVIDCQSQTAKQLL